VNRLAAPAVLVAVTMLLDGYGRFAWSWLGGPVAALAIYGLDRTGREPAAPAPATGQALRREPAPVD
jgi:hypothetical protein